MPAMTRGPLPARVYWVRRLVVLGIAALLVIGIARLLGGGSDASSEPDRAAPAAADIASRTSSTSTPSTSSTGEPTGVPVTMESGPDSSQEPVLAAPEGTCAEEDIAVTPKVDGAVAGRDVRIVLQLRTLESEACTWRVSHDSLTISITSGQDDIWSSRDCPRSIPVRDVVVRKAVTTNVDVIWKSARRSGEDCYLRADWADLGWYHVTTAALGGEPSDLQFQLTRPSPVTITRTATPSQRPSGRPVTPSKSPAKSPSGAVEPR
jgi:hypothetical protein